MSGGQNEASGGAGEAAGAQNTQAADSGAPKDGKEAGGGGHTSGKDGAGTDQGKASVWEGFAESFGEDCAFDRGILQSFAENAAKSGLSPEQAAGLVKWQLGAIKEAFEKLKMEGLAALQKEWGAATGKNLNDALKLVTRVDQLIGNDSFSQALTRFGIANDADFVRGLYRLADMLGEDTVGGVSAMGAEVKEEEPLEALQKIFGKG